MRIHSDKVTLSDITEAERFATRNSPGVDPVIATRWTEHGSRKRTRAWDVILTGSNSRRQNGGPDQAATWDEWGWFLAHLFTVDPNAVAGPYKGSEDFHRKTANVYTGNRYSR